MASISTNYDPTTTAQALATSSTAARQESLTRQTTAAATTVKALTTLGSTLTTFQNALASLSGVNKTISANSAVFSDTGVASATASASAAAGSYAFFVAKVATAHTVSYSGVAGFTGGATGGKLTLGVGAVPGPNSFDIDLTTKPDWTVRDLAAAINSAPTNTSLSASVVTTGTDALGAPISELVLTSKLTGLANTISLTATTDVDSELATSLDSANAKDLTLPDDALVHIGSSGGTPITSASNTLSIIDGVTMTLSKAQAAGSAPVTLTVGTDTAKTTANVQAFVDAYNKMKAAVDGLVAPGDPASGSSAGAFASDSGVRSLRDRMVGLLRGAGATSLASFGILATREGTLSLDTTRLTKALAANPTGLDTLIGSAASATPTGIAGQLQTYLKVWTNSVNGQIGSRKDAIGKLQMTLTDRQTTLDRQYDSAYARYLAQFTKLQTIQSSMSYNTSLFDAMFSNSKD
jgi:flagellar hook-associated protein 2